MITTKLNKNIISELSLFFLTDTVKKLPIAHIFKSINRQNNAWLGQSDRQTNHLSNKVVTSLIVRDNLHNESIIKTYFLSL